MKTYALLTRSAASASVEISGTWSLLSGFWVGNWLLVGMGGSESDVDRVHEDLEYVALPDLAKHTVLEVELFDLQADLG